MTSPTSRSLGRFLAHKFIFAEDYLLLAGVSLGAVDFFSYANAVSAEAGLCREAVPASVSRGHRKLPAVPQLLCGQACCF